MLETLLGLIALIGGITDTTIVYAQEPEAPRVVLIEEYIDWTPLRIETEIRKTFPEDSENAVKIAKCESGLDKDIVSPTNDHGIMQINMTVHEERVKELGIDVYDVRDNLKFARMLYDERKWKPWVCADILGIE